MISRRDILAGAGVAGVLSLGRGIASAFASASQPGTPVNFDVPKGACDCHSHIFDPRKFPYPPERIYTPESAFIAETRSLHRALHTERMVVVQPSVYGTDNSCTLDAIKQLGPGARGIAVIGQQTSEADLDQMHGRGIRGVRINLETSGQADPAVARQRLKGAVERIKEHGNWHIEMYARLSVIEAIQDDVIASPLPVSFDHFGGAQPALGVNQPGFDVLLNLVKSGKSYVKISGPYLNSALTSDYAGFTPLAQALIAANPQRIVWGTDWPHTHPVAGRKPEEITPFDRVDDGRDFNQLAIWVPNSALRKTILVDNPARLYGF